MFFFFAVSLVLQAAATRAGDPCPPRAELAPCTCSVTVVPGRFRQDDGVTADEPPSRPRREVVVLAQPSTTTTESSFSLAATPALADSGQNYTVVDCKVSRSVANLEETVSSALERRLVDELVVANVPPRKEHTLARLPSGWLKKVRVRHFKVVNSTLSGDFLWHGNPFEGQAQSLQWFSANRCFLAGALTHDTVGTVNTKGLNALPRVERVDLSDNFLTAVMALAFRWPPANLSHVDLSHNSISFIEGGAFHHVAKLSHLSLAHNLLESVARSVFASPAKHLEFIDLSWNSLTTLPADFFTNMPSLKMVGLMNNFLYSLPEKPWAMIWKQLTRIDVTGNFVDCNCDLLWLLPILSPPKANVTTTPSPTPLPGQSIKGSCSKTVQPFAVKYDLITLTRDRLNC